MSGIERVCQGIVEQPDIWHSAIELIKHSWWAILLWGIIALAFLVVAGFTTKANGKKFVILTLATVIGFFLGAVVFIMALSM